MWVCRCMLYTLLLYLPLLGVSLQPNSGSVIKRAGIYLDVQHHPGSYYSYNGINQDIREAWIRYKRRHALEQSTFSTPLKESIDRPIPGLLVFFEPLPNIAGETMTMNDAWLILAEVRSRTIGIQGTVNSLTWSAARGGHPGTPDSRLLARGYAVGLPTVAIGTVKYISGAPAGIHPLQDLQAPISAAETAIDNTMEKYDRFPARWSHYFHAPSQSTPEPDVGILITTISQEQQSGPSRHDLLVINVRLALVKVQTQLKNSREVGRLISGFRCDILQDKRDARSRYAVPTDLVKVGEVIVMALEPALALSGASNTTARLISATE